VSASGDGSVSVWIEGVKTGCEAAATNIWKRYRKQIHGIARAKLGSAVRTVADEEDVAVIAFQSFLRRCRDGSYPDLHDRTDLWRLLVTITVHKASNQARDQACLKRSAPQVEGASVLTQSGPVHGWDHLISMEPDPELSAAVSDSLNHLLGKISDGELRSIVLYKLEGYSNPEIAEKIGRSLPTIERRLRLIRETWRRELAD
jgi:RNA polymerase sigma factor (sigma-70 family)